MRGSNAGVTIGLPRREPCAKCGLPVFIAERLNIGKQLFHRTCFQCARCNSQLTLENYYELESGSQYCCETCPDEERVPEPSEKAVMARSLSDEEKSASLKLTESTVFQTALDFDELEDSTCNSEFTKARSQFISTLIGGSDDDQEPPDLPKTKPPDFQLEPAKNFSSIDSGIPSMDISVSNNNNNSSSSSNGVKGDSALPKTNSELDKNIVTKENVQENTSLVQARMRLFQGNTTQSSVPSTKKPDAIQSDSKAVVLDKSIEDLVQVADSKEIINSSIIVTDDSLLSGNSLAAADEEEIARTSCEVIEICDSNSESNIVIDLCGDSVEDGEVISIEESKESNIGDQLLQTVPHIELQITTEEESLLIEDKPSEVIEILENEKGSSLIEDDAVQANDEEIEESPIGDVKPPPRTKPTKPSTEEIQYPEDLNPFDDIEPKASLNPFGSGDEDDDDDEEDTQEVPTLLKKILVPEQDYKLTSGSTGDTPESMKTLRVARISVNPFEHEVPTPSVRRIISVEKPFNPFSDDEDEHESTDDAKKPTALPRTSLNNAGSLTLPGRNLFGSSTSISSGASSINSVRKKKPAPRPPLPFESQSQSTSPSTSVHQSPRLRKHKKAPLPPSSTPLTNQRKKSFPRISQYSPVEGDSKQFILSPASSVDSGEYEKEKVVKDEANRNRQSQTFSAGTPEDMKYPLIPSSNKSTHGKWKRKKGLAPSRPVPQKRTIKALPIIEVRRELDIIEVQLQGLEKQGVRLEQIIREHCEGPNSDPEGSVSIEAEDLILQLFEVVNEKNEICRRQSELMYIQRQHRLEVEYAEVEYQIRCLMLQPEANKTDSDKAGEEELLSRLVEIVEKRNEIVECLEMDRVREAEEDDSINTSMNTYALKRDEQSASSEIDSPKKKEKKRLKLKKFKPKFKLSSKVDADKDVDESESSVGSSNSCKDKKKKKFNLF